MKNIKYMYLKKYDYIQKKEKYRKKNFLYFFLIDINPLSKDISDLYNHKYKYIFCFHKIDF